MPATGLAGGGDGEEREGFIGSGFTGSGFTGSGFTGVGEGGGRGTGGGREVEVERVSGGGAEEGQRFRVSRVVIGVRR